MRTLAISGHRCKDILDKSSASLLLMHALRQLRHADVQCSDSPQKAPKSMSRQAAVMSPLPGSLHDPGASVLLHNTTSLLSTKCMMHATLPISAVVGATLVAGSVLVKGRTASETYGNYRDLSRMPLELDVSFTATQLNADQNHCNRSNPQQTSDASQLWMRPPEPLL
jgi:hypothetical protein